MNKSTADDMPKDSDDEALRHVEELMGPAPSLDNKPVSVPPMSKPPQHSRNHATAKQESDSKNQNTSVTSSTVVAVTTATAPMLPGKLKNHSEAATPSGTQSDLKAPRSLPDELKVDNQPEATEPDAEVPVEAASASSVQQVDDDTTTVNPVKTGQLNASNLAAAQFDRSDPAIDAAVADIERAEADAALREETELPDNLVSNQIESESAPLYSDKSHSVRWWKGWWQDPTKRYALIIGLLLIIALIIGVPAIRAAALNAAGVRTTLALTAIDGSSGLPLEKVLVEVSGVSAKTNAEGTIKIRGVKMGNQTVTIAKPGFATITRPMQFEMRAVDLEEVELKAVGTQYTYRFTDYLSGKPIVNAALMSGEATAKSDKTGKAIITIPPGDAIDAKIRVDAKGYRVENLDIPALGTTAADIKRALVPAHKAVYVSKETGVYTVYKMDIDGQHKEVLLEGTGHENQSIVLQVNPTGNKAALVATRDNQRNTDGYLLQSLTIIDIDSGENETIEHAESILLHGWRDTTLVYSLVGAAPSAARSNRQRVQAYDYASSKRMQLANANYMNAVFMHGPVVYYIVSNTDPGMKAGLYRVNIDGSSRRTIMEQELWSVIQTDYKTVLLQSPTKWFTYTFDNNSAQEASAPADSNSKQYVDSPDYAYSARVDTRDLKGALLVRNAAKGAEQPLTTQKNMRAVSRWLTNRAVVFYVASADEAAEYVVSLDGGEPKKIADVSPSMQYDR